MGFKPRTGSPLWPFSCWTRLATSSLIPALKPAVPSSLPWQDKRFASGKYQDVYAELNHIKVRSEREIEQLKEHLRLAMAALQEKESLCNSVGE